MVTDRGTTQATRTPYSCIIEHKLLPVRFLIIDCPNDSSLQDYIDVINVQSQKTCKIVVRLCEEKFYSKDLFSQKSGLTVVDDIKIEDGQVPNKEHIAVWRSLVDKSGTKDPNCGQCSTVTVHCVSGIGRAPVFVAISLVDYGLDPFDAIEYIRKQRPGALNKAQVRFIMDQKYKRRKESSSIFRKLKIFG